MVTTARMLSCQNGRINDIFNLEYSSEDNLQIHPLLYLSQVPIVNTTHAPLHFSLQVLLNHLTNECCATVYLKYSFAAYSSQLDKTFPILQFFKRHIKRDFHTLTPKGIMYNVCGEYYHFLCPFLKGCLLRTNNHLLAMNDFWCKLKIQCMSHSHIGPMVQSPLPFGNCHNFKSILPC